MGESRELDAIERRASIRRSKVAERIEAKASLKELTSTLHDIEYAIRKYKGSLFYAAEFLGTTRRVLWYKIQRTPSLQQLLRDIDEEKVDRAEYKLEEHVEAGSLPAIIMTLKTKGKRRGWSERVVEIEDSNSLNPRTAAELIETIRKASEKPLEIESKDYTWLLPEVESAESLEPLS